MTAMTGRPKGLHYTSVLLVLGFLAHVSAQQQQRADVRPPATVTAQAYSAEQVQAGQTAFASRCGFCHGRDAAGGESGPDLTRSTAGGRGHSWRQARAALVRAGRRRPAGCRRSRSRDDRRGLAIVAFIHDQKTEVQSQSGRRTPSPWIAAGPG